MLVIKHRFEQLCSNTRNLSYEVIFTSRSFKRNLRSTFKMFEHILDQYHPKYRCSSMSIHAHRSNTFPQASEVRSSNSTVRTAFKGLEHASDARTGAAGR